MNSNSHPAAATLATGNTTFPSDPFVVPEQDRSRPCRPGMFLRRTCHVRHAHLVQAAYRDKIDKRRALINID
jgi:hypothetical protein